jgi:ribosomal protein L20A (L18A)
MHIQDKADLMAEINFLLKDGFKIRDIVSALEDSEFLDKLHFDSELTEYQKQSIVEKVYSDLSSQLGIQ